MDIQPPADDTATLIRCNIGSVFATPNSLPNQWCVYMHANSDDETVQYVGMCKLSEAFGVPDARRNSLWGKTFHNTTFRMVIVGIASNLPEAANYRSKLIQQFRPPCNVNGFDVTGHGIRTAIMCNETGETFDTISAAAEAHGVSQSQISSHLAGRKYYLTVKGRTYRRIDG